MHARDPHICQVCGSDLVHPVRWDGLNHGAAWVQLHCGSCETWCEASFGAHALAKFDRKLSRDERRIAAAADRLHRDWRMAEAETFAAALDHDLIDAGDFTR